MNRTALDLATRGALALIALLAVACGDDATAQNPDASGPDAPTVTPPRAVAVTGDFGPGNPGVMASLDPETLEVTLNVAPQGAIGDDPMLRKFGDELFVVNRTTNNVTILNATTFALVEQLATGAATNPQDVAVRGAKLYVPALAGKGVLVLTRGSTTITEIDLSADDPDGKPNCASIYLVDNRLFVACGLLDDTDALLTPRGPGRVYVIDTTTDTRTATITLATKNPIALFERSPIASPLGGDLVIPTVDFGDNNAGCIERVSTGVTPAANGCVVTNTTLGGFANRIDFETLANGGALLWLAVNEAFPNATLRGYDLETATLWDAITPATQVITDVVSCPGGRVVVSDQKMDAAGLRVLESTEEQTTAPLNIGLAPKSAHGLVCY